MFFSRPLGLPFCSLFSMDHSSAGLCDQLIFLGGWVGQTPPPPLCLGSFCGTSVIFHRGLRPLHRGLNLPPPSLKIACVTNHVGSHRWHGSPGQERQRAGQAYPPPPAMLFAPPKNSANPVGVGGGGEGADHSPSDIQSTRGMMILFWGGVGLY